jgi:hypothetical protein
VTAALVALALVVRGVVAWLRQHGQLTGKRSEDRRRVLAALGGLGLAGLFGADAPAVEPPIIKPIAANSGRWVRIGPRPDWRAAASWFIDPELGDDGNDGLSAAAPLRTHGGLWKRLGYGAAPGPLIDEGEGS